MPREDMLLLVRQPHNEGQRDVEPRDIFVIEMTYLSPNSLAPNGHWFVGHYLRNYSQTVALGRFKRYAKILRLAAI
jgi:hypothetical protein